MKVRMDFVTNSSSASMYLYIRSSHKTLKEFSNALNIIFESDVRLRDSVTFLNPKNVTEFVPGVYRLEEHISMYNYFEDLPWYFQWIVWKCLTEKAEMQVYGIDEIVKVEIKFDY